MKACVCILLWLAWSSLAHALEVPEGTILRDQIIQCQGSTGVELASHVKLINVDIRGCPLLIQGVTDVEVWDSRVRQSPTYGILVQDSTALLSGVFVTKAQGDGIHVERSHVLMDATLVYNSPNPSSIGIYFDDDSTGRIARSRSRYGGMQAIRVPTTTAVGMTASVCGTPLGGAVCAPGRYGPSVDRVFTVCGPNSYQNGYCDFMTPDFSQAQLGDVYILDTAPGASSWPFLDVTVPGVTVRSTTDGGDIGGLQLSGAMQGAYKYVNPVVGYGGVPGVVFSGFRLGTDNLFYDAR